MMFSRFLPVLILMALVLPAGAQKIVYSEPDSDDTRRMSFEVIGKIAGNFLIYKNIRGKNYISVYDNDMKQVAREEQDYIPEERLINIDFFPYADHAYLVYEYQKRNVVYCNAVKVDGNGKKISSVQELDTAHISFTASNKVYSVVNSEDRNQVMVFKINSRNKSNYVLTTLLFDKNLTLRKRSVLNIPMEDRNDYRLGEFNVDNDGDFIFTKLWRSSNDNIGKVFLYWKPALADSALITDLGIDTPAGDQKKIYLDELKIKVDNPNKRYFLSSFYYEQKRGNIEGFYFYVWDKATQKTGMENRVAFTDELRQEAKGEANQKMAFNDYFIRNIIVRRDGGFLIGSEAYYTTSRLNNWNRWDYLYGSPFNSRLDYYSYSPIISNGFWRNRYGGSGQSPRYHADNIALLSFDKNGKLEWNNVIHKEQWSDESDDQISYQMVNTGGQLHLVFNQPEKRTMLLNDFVISADGKINRNPTLKNLDRDYEFMVKYGKQVSARTMIVPCYYRNYICFAKIDYNS